MRGRVQGGVREQYRLRVRDVGRAGQRQHVLLAPRTDLRGRDDPGRAHPGHLQAPGPQEVREQRGHVLRIRRPDRDPPYADLPGGVHEGERRRGRRHAGQPGEGAHLLLRALPAVHEAATGAGPHHRLGAGQPQCLHARREPLGGPHLAQRRHPVRVLADVGVDQVHPDVAAQELLDAWIVVLGGVARVEESECGHVQPSCVSSGSTGGQARAASSSSA